MPTTLDVFISSKMVELKAERDAIFKLIPTLNYGDIQLHAWVFEEDAGAVGKPIREVYLNALQNSALYLGLFWQQYGEYTIDEFDRATEWGMERHIYVKDVEADKRDPKLADFLNKHGDVKSGITAKWFKTTEELCKAIQRSIENWISDRLRYRSGASAVFATDPDDLTEKPKVLFGRDELLKDVLGLLEKHEQVLLQGFGGMGKTALAATLAANWIKDGKGSVLWLKAGSTETDALFEALARAFNAQQAIASQIGDAKTKALRDLLRRSGATLLVLDDCWNNKALFALIKAVPSDMALLVTARQRYPLSKIRPVDELAPSDALALLSYHADQTFTPINVSTPPLYAMERGLGGEDNNAAALCALLGNHAFAIEIAGKTLKVHNWSPVDLIAQIKDAPDQMTMPLELSQSGRENVAKLLEVSLNALDEETRNVFLAFGAFFAPQTTPEMLMRYFINKKEISDDLVREFKSRKPQFDSLSDSEIRVGLKKAMNDKINAEPTQKVLDTLHLNGLAERLPATDDSITAYRVHDLAYSYARSQATDDQHQRALKACLSYTQHYNQPSLHNFAALRPELDNFLGAASWALKHQHYKVVEDFAWDLYAAGSQYLDYTGLYRESTHLLLQAAQAAQCAGSKRNQATHLGNLGLAYRDLGQIEKAINYFRQALTIQLEIGDKRGEANQLGNLGLAYGDLGQMEKAIECHRQALNICQQIGDKQNEEAQLGNLGLAYRDLGQIEKAINYFQQALTIQLEIGDKRGEGIQLGNLGLAYRDLGQIEKAIDYFQQALVISKQISDKRNEGQNLSNLGIAYFDLGQIEKSVNYLQQAIAIAREIGDQMYQANQLNNLGTAYNDLKDYPRALQHFQQARAIFFEIGSQHLLATIDQNIANTQANMNDKNDERGFFGRLFNRKK